MESHGLSWIPERNPPKEQDGIAVKEKKSPPQRLKAGTIIIKGRSLPLLEIAVLHQVGHEPFGSIGGNCHTMRLVVTRGKPLHILPVGTITVEPAPLTEQPDELFRTGSGYPAAIQ